MSDSHDHGHAGEQWGEFFDAPQGVHSSGPTTGTGYMTVDSTFDGGIAFVGDSDWIRVSLVAGETYTISMFSYTMETFLALADNTGTVLVTDDFELYNVDGLTVAASTFEVTATRTGDYYVIAEESGVNSTGAYSVGVFSDDGGGGPLEPATLDEIAHQLTDDGWALFNGERRSYTENTITYNVSEMSSTSKKFAKHAFESWSKLTGLTFEKTNGDAMITFSDDQDGAFANSAIGPDGSITSSIINIATDWDQRYGVGLDSYLFQTFIHEIGHTLGLAHAGNYNASLGPATFPESVLYENDTWNTTIMSYIDQLENTEDNADKAFVMTPMIADIIAIQDLYGAPNRAYHGDTTYGVGSNTGDYMDIIFSALTDSSFTHNLILGNRPLSFTLWDTGGTDTVDLSTDTMAQRVDLRDKKISDIYGVDGAMVIARGTVIENYFAGSAGDKLKGNEGQNLIKGNDGADVIDGLGGADQLRGNAGKDKLIGGSGGDELFGGDGKDDLRGGKGTDDLRGGKGSDTLNGQAGNDTLSGGANADVFKFANKGDKDRIVDFENNLDTLQLNDNLWSGTKTKQQIFNQYGTESNGNVILNFGDGDRIIIEDMTFSSLRNDMEFA